MDLTDYIIRARGSFGLAEKRMDGDFLLLHTFYADGIFHGMHGGKWAKNSVEARRKFLEDMTESEKSGALDIGTVCRSAAGKTALQHFTSSLELGNPKHSLESLVSGTWTIYSSSRGRKATNMVGFINHGLRMLGIPEIFVHSSSWTAFKKRSADFDGFRESVIELIASSVTRAYAEQKAQAEEWGAIKDIKAETGAKAIRIPPGLSWIGEDGNKYAFRRLPDELARTYRARPA